MRRHSPYNYAFNNPVYFIDPDGMMPGGFSNTNLTTSTGSFESYGGFDVNTVDKEENVLETQHHTNINDANKAAAGIQATIDSGGSGSSNNSGAYKSFFQQVSKDIANSREDSYVAGEGNISSDQFRDTYAGMTEGEIMRGESSFLGYKYPNRMADKSTRFVMLPNGKEVDMIHFMVVGRAGHVLGFANEVQQAFQFSNSAFNPQDLYSNKLGINFFRSYGPLIEQNPTQISNYIHQYLNSPGVLNPPPFQPQYPTGIKY